jgi:DNA-binding Xre family transcriptional regulator
MIMATRNICMGVELKRILEDKSGLSISSAGISRLLNEEQTEIKLTVLDALCKALKCGLDELFVQTVVDASKEEEDQRNA